MTATLTRPSEQRPRLWGVTTARCTLGPPDSILLPLGRMKLLAQSEHRTVPEGARLVDGQSSTAPIEFHAKPHGFVTFGYLRPDVDVEDRHSAQKVAWHCPHRVDKVSRRQTFGDYDRYIDHDRWKAGGLLEREKAH